MNPSSILRVLGVEIIDGCVRIYRDSVVSPDIYGVLELDKILSTKRMKRIGNEMYDEIYLDREK